MFVYTTQEIYTTANLQQKMLTTARCCYCSNVDCTC